uniref:Uncharacterized protein n=1 Tax=Sus scrofa TaxID=9823 RepID=A0A8D1LAF0_PIG
SATMNIILLERKMGVSHADRIPAVGQRAIPVAYTGAGPGLTALWMSHWHLLKQAENPYLVGRSVKDPALLLLWLSFRATRMANRSSQTRVRTMAKKMNSYL